jgi:hypothetical protein
MPLTTANASSVSAIAVKGINENSIATGKSIYFI